MAAKIFEVGDVLPATTQLRISWNFDTPTHTGYIQTYGSSSSVNYGNLVYQEKESSPPSEFTLVLTTQIYDFGSWNSPYTGVSSNHAYIDIDISNWTETERTIKRVDFINTDKFYWEDLNAPQGYSITFEENGGSTVTDLTEQTALPTPLPTPTKSGYTFRGWYYDGDFTNEALAGDLLTGDVTLYAKWELNTYTITFEENGGLTIPDIEDATELPNPLPPTTKPGYTFGGWYYESNFQTRAKAGDTIEANTTLYAKWLTLAQVIEHINNVVEELRSAIIDKGGDAEGKLLIDFATIINSLKTYEVVETLAELELLEPALNRIVFVVEGGGELAMGAPVKVTQDGDTLIIG